MRKNSDERQSTSRGAHPTPNDARTKMLRTRVNGIVGITPVHLARARQPEKKMQCCPYLVPQQFQSYGVREADRKRMLGHSFEDDITNGVYGHRTLEELREQIEKIRI